ncbi:uncharacterized protein LOC128547094 [Mercenaria mercenaria]|uniref:uncharacterized protein LOC128547094 n=1 Tax=Mercenaria mercenaria TaxID=6596 RepID=UPI00234EADA8|nr:uncharacterized protein LOC128547094 [Mercenaria mercenaria]
MISGRIVRIKQGQEHAIQNMAYIDYIIYFTVVLATSRTTEGVVCKNDTMCGSGECCYIKPALEVVSRRQASILPVLPGFHDTGICEKYRVEHEYCGLLEQANGHCGCGPGLLCKSVPAASTLQPLVVSKKRDIYMPGPGSFQCEMKP